MSGQNVFRLHPNRRPRSAVAENSTVATLVLVIVEGMMFAGLVSAFMITRAAAGGAWPPAGPPRLPPGAAAINAAALLASGALLFLAARAWRKREPSMSPLLLAAIALGAFFLFFQGSEWVALIRQGLDLAASPHVNFFSLIVGMQGAHALGALSFMLVAWLHLRRGSLSRSAFSAARILWYFVVGAWPPLYLFLYL